MADLILEVGLGKTYDGVNGFINAFNALPTDMNSVADNVRIRVWPDYTYNWFPTVVTYNPSNPSASKKVIIEPAPGYEHNGVFDSGVIILWDSAGSVGRVDMYYNFFEIHDIQFRVGLNHNAGIVFFRMYGSTCNVERILVDHYNYYSYIFQYVSTGGGLFNNNIFWSPPGSGGGVYFLENYGTGTLEVNNNLAYGAIFLLGNSSSVSAKNNGSIQNGSFWGFQSYSNVVGAGNYTTVGGGSFGTNFLTTTEVACKFKNVFSKNLDLLLGSPLIGTGSENSVNNPYAINREPWNGNHRSPYNTLIILNAFELPPDDTDTVYDSWNNDMVLNILAPGLPPTIGALLPNSVETGSVQYSHVGPVNLINRSMRYRAKSITSTKKMTIATMLRNPSSNTYTLGSDAALENGLVVISSTQIQFKNGSFTATFSPSSVINTSDFFSLIFCMDLEKPVNSEKFKVYIYQKGGMYLPVVSFSGTAPSTVSIPQWRIDGPNAQGITSVWFRALTKEEIYILSCDPYVMYRDNTKMLLANNVFPSGLNLWFLRKFIMGD